MYKVVAIMQNGAVMEVASGYTDYALAWDAAKSFMMKSGLNIRSVRVEVCSE